jgi:hypothetical protein
MIRRSRSWKSGRRTYVVATNNLVGLVFYSSSEWGVNIVSPSRGIHKAVMFCIEKICFRHRSQFSIWVSENETLIGGIPLYNPAIFSIDVSICHIPIRSGICYSIAVSVHLDRITPVVY